MADGTDGLERSGSVRSRWTTILGRGLALGDHLNWRRYSVLIFVLFIAGVYHYLTGGLFLTRLNLVNLSEQFAITALIAVGMVMVLISAEIDLSAGSALGFCAIVAALIGTRWGFGSGVAIGFTLLMGMSIGVLQGSLVAWAGVPSLVVTLGGMMAFRGLGLVVTEGQTIAPISSGVRWFGQGDLPFWWGVVLILVMGGYRLTDLYRRDPAAFSGSPRESSRGAQIGKTALVVGVALGVLWYVFGNRGIPVPVFVLGSFALALSYLMNRTVFGRRLYATGGNREATRMAGVDIPLHLFGVFVIMGVFYAVGGMMLAGRLNGAPPNGGFFVELEAIAAAVIGGTSLMGGRGRVIGAVLGALLLETIDNGMSLMNVMTYYQYIASAIILIIAVFFDVTTRNERSR